MCDIPSIGELCRKLGFENATEEDIEELRRVTRRFLQSHDLPPRMELENLLDWDKPTSAMELRYMAISFLSDDDHRNGERFWGSKGILAAEGVRHPERNDRIVTLLMQLFWRQNKETFDLKDGDTQARCTSRDNVTLGSEDIQCHRSTSRSCTMRRESPDPQTSVHDRKGKSIAITSPQSGSDGVGNADATHSPEDLDDRIRNAIDYLSKDDQIVAQTQPETPPSGINTRKRKAPSSDGPRRSGRKPKEIKRPEFIPPDDIEDLTSDRSSSGSLEQSIERDEQVDGELSWEMELPSNTSTNRNIDSDMVDASPLERRLHKGTTAPMSPSAKKTTIPLSKEKTHAPLSSTSKASAKAKISSTILTRKAPPVGHKILKLNMPWKMPSTKAQSKPPREKLPAEVRPKTPPIQEEGNATGEPFASNGGSDSFPNRFQPPNPTSEPCQLPPLPPAAEVITTPTSLPHPPAAYIASAPTSTSLSSLTGVQIWVVTYSPKRTEEWLHGVQLAGTSLPSFLASIAGLSDRSVDDIDKIKLTLEMPMLNTKVTVRRGQDKIWESTKRTFAERLGLQCGEQSLEKCMIFVEPLWEEGKAGDWKEVDGGAGEGGLYDA
ncbi:hypothetical protein DL98DRAFT_657767 [Cadophora sp. DSE1049]|nr:hypothetical protein DL98DRAFT_657767 [Cadophora sp. DSE1049]